MKNVKDGSKFLIAKKMKITDDKLLRLFNEAYLKLRQTNPERENPFTSESKRVGVVFDVLEKTSMACHAFSVETILPTEPDKELFLQNVMLTLLIFENACKRNAKWVPNKNISKHFIRWFNGNKSSNEKKVWDNLYYKAIRAVTADLMFELNELTNQLIEQLGLDKAPSDYVFFCKTL